jgi:hypothetical protein
MVHKNSNAKVTVWHRGFKYTLTNGYTLSVAFGAGNYCDNQNKPLFEDETWYESSDFEVAVFEPNDEIVDLIPAEGEDKWSDQVIGFVPAAALPMLISALKFWPVREEFQNEPETFEKVLRARCRIFRNICKDYMDKVDKEARASV